MGRGGGFSCWDLANLGFPLCMTFATVSYLFLHISDAVTGGRRPGCMLFELRCSGASSITRVCAYALIICSSFMYIYVTTSTGTQMLPMFKIHHPSGVHQTCFHQGTSADAAM